MKTIFYFLFAVSCWFTHNADGQPKKSAVKKQVNLNLVFSNTIDEHPVVLFDSSYSNPFAENFVLTKVKYYVSGITLYKAGKAISKSNQYFLIDQVNEKSLIVHLNFTENNYDSIGFLLGVDSARNCSGAQTGALDPMNDMFWTWHSGYVMQKLEGTSTQSNLPNHKFEYHLGGYSGNNSVLNFITIPFPGGQPLSIKKSTLINIHIQAAINHFWNAQSNIKISETPSCTTIGLLAKQMANNFKTIFTITEIK